MNKIVSVSQFIRVLLVIAAILQLGMWSYFSFFMDGISSEGVDIHSASLNLVFSFDDLRSEADQVASAGLNPVFWLTIHNTVLKLWMYSLLFSLFARFSRAEIFAHATVIQIKRIGQLLIIWPVVEMIYPGLFLLTLKLLGLLEHGEINLALGTQHLGTMASGLMIMVVGWVMAEATRLKNEQDLVI